MRILTVLLLFLAFAKAESQTSTYSISFENAVHHEAQINVTFPQLEGDTLVVRMARTSPGRYALHEFAKNVYGVKATDSQGKSLDITRSEPYSWKIQGHDGTVNLEYTLFANRGDGTYSQVDGTHAHLNIPATFMYAESLRERSIEVDFKVREELDWKVATQLKPLSGTTYYAPNLYYFMDSPTEISNYDLREFQVNSQNVRFVLHHPGTAEELDTYFDQVKRIVLQQRAVYGELPKFDYGEYTFLACYMPNISGDGMEHRNSTVLTDTESLAQGGMEDNIGTVSHEFFHAWNVERIRPADLEPFDFTEVNMSDCLWFAEGFTSYYDDLILCRAGIISPEDYISSLAGGFNYVWNSPALDYFNPIEMSRQAPFVDAATSVDPVNRENTFVSYYSYGAVLGLALDLSLREKGFNLDDNMKSVWKAYGKPENPYTIPDLEKTLIQYAGADFATDFFNRFIYDSQMPDYAPLFERVGITLSRKQDEPSLGIQLTASDEGVEIARNTAKGSPAYAAGLDQGDIITGWNGNPVAEISGLREMINNHKPGDTVRVDFKRFGAEKSATLILGSNPAYTIVPTENPTESQLKARKAWLGEK